MTFKEYLNEISFGKDKKETNHTHDIDTELMNVLHSITGFTIGEMKKSMYYILRNVRDSNTSSISDIVIDMVLGKAIFTDADKFKLKSFINDNYESLKAMAIEKTERGII